MRPSFFHHLHPPTIPAHQARLRYTLGAGGLSVFLALILTASGILLMFYYVPTPQEASASIHVITYLAPYGALIRNLHYWAAQLLVITTSLHLLRVIFTGAYAQPRRFNYLLGLTLLALTLFLDFTGYILRWDEGVRWALVAGTNLIREIPWIGEALYLLIMGAPKPGPATLLRFYAWHIFGLTILMAIIGGWHIFRVRRDGGIAAPPPAARQSNARITRFELVRREAIAALIAGVVLLLLALTLPAPLAPAMTDVTAQTADSRAPWFFLWVQELLKLGDAFWMGVAIPFGVLLILALIPYLLPNALPEELGAWFPRRARGAQLLSALLFALIIGLTLKALFAP
jgi:quinol-cytochrome oxidoreductase complex cytochrome b subunit